MENISIDDRDDDAHEKILKTESLAEILQEDLSPFRSTQGQGIYSRVTNNRRGWNNRGVGHCNNY